MRGVCERRVYERSVYERRVYERRVYERSLFLPTCRDFAAFSPSIRGPMPFSV
jgi:hypothetical protein